MKLDVHRPRPRPSANHKVTVAEYESALFAYKSGRKRGDVVGAALSKDAVHFTPAMFSRLYGLIDKSMDIGLNKTLGSSPRISTQPSPT